MSSPNIWRTTLRARPTPWTVVMVIGDVAIFTLFAIIGQQSHEVGVTLLGTLQNALPLAAAWLVIGKLLGAFQVSTTICVGNAWKQTFLAWIPAGLAGLVIRYLWLGHGLEPTFIAIALSVNLAMLITWRIVFTLALGWWNTHQALKGRPW